MSMIIKFILIIVISYCSASNNISLGYDLGQYYSRVRIFEYEDYSDVKLLKFHIYGPTNLARWLFLISTNGKCSNYEANVHFNLQHGAYPLITPKNESFPTNYISTRHDLTRKVFNQTVSNGTVQLKNPLRGTWFLTTFLERLPISLKPKKSSTECNIYLTTWLNYEALTVSLTLSLEQRLQLVLPNNATALYASYYAAPGNGRVGVLSEWLTDCEITILGRINGLPTSSNYDYQTVCKNGACSMELDQLSAFMWIYFQISANNVSCLNDSVHGYMLVYSKECTSSSNNDTCIQSYPTQRIILNPYYEFLYIPVNADKNISSITFYGNESSIYSYEFIVDDRNIGGTMQFEFKTELKPYMPPNANVSILGCLSKHQPRRYQNCESDFKIFIDQNSNTARSLPYPEMALWYLTLEYSCNGSITACENTFMTLTFQILSTQCTRDECGTYGSCRIITSHQNVYSVCLCIAGYRGYGCTDDTYSYASRYLPSVLLLTLSNLMFIPAVVVAAYYRLYIEALVYFFNMFFSTFYHACDQDLYRFCMFKYDGLQLSDFIGSYSSFVITLITMSIVPRSVKTFLFVLGLLACVAINSRDRFDDVQFIVLVALTFAFTVGSWIIASIKKRRLQPSWKRLLWISPGIVFSIIGLILFVVVSNEDNYWYTHSLWHMLMASSILFFLPKKIQETQRQRQPSETSQSRSSCALGNVNKGAILPDEEEGNINAPS